MCENRLFFAQWLHYGLQVRSMERLIAYKIKTSRSQTYLIDGMRDALLWLNSWPAGLKLNTELSQFYCHSLVGLVSVWGCTSPISPQTALPAHRLRQSRVA